MELLNGAVFSMALTETGSSRLGVQDFVQLRAGDVTVEIENDSRYKAENSRAILRRARGNRMDSYRRMYTEIATRVANGESADPFGALSVSARAVLQIEDSARAAQHSRTVSTRTTATLVSIS
jgi:hypothetical protein